MPRIFGIYNPQLLFSDSWPLVLTEINQELFDP